MGIVYGFFYSRMQLICKAKTIQLHSVSKKSILWTRWCFTVLYICLIHFNASANQHLYDAFFIINNPIQ